MEKEKIFYGLSLVSDYKGNLTLKGDFGVVRYSVIKGYNELNFNLVSTKLQVELESDRKKGAISTIKIFFREAE